MPGCGKEEVLKVAQKMGFTVLRMGDLVREEAKRRGLGATDESIGTMADEERRRHGPGVWAARTIPLFRGEDRYLVDGVRNLQEVEIFRKSFGDSVAVLAVTSTEENRFQRLQARARADDPQMREEFGLRDRREIGWGLAEAIGSADLVIQNDGSLQEFRIRIRAALKGLPRRNA